MSGITRASFKLSRFSTSSCCFLYTPLNGKPSTLIQLKPARIDSQHKLGCKHLSTSCLLSFNRTALSHRSGAKEESKGNEKVYRYFPSPISSLQSLKQIIEGRQGIKTSISFSYKVITGGYHCSLYLKWPEDQIFCGTGSRKKIAQAEASFNALSWLLDKKYIDERCKPVFTADKNTHFACLNEQKLSSIDNVLRTYFEEVMPALKSFSLQNDLPGQTDENRIHPVLGVPMPAKMDLENWSRQLQEGHVVSTSDLPVEAFRDSIIKAVKDSKVTIIEGETGCGKSTQVPQLILDDAIKKGQGAFCNVVVSQPRRITAVELARRVAEERNEKVGITVGYSVKLDNKFPRTLGGSIMFFTAGKLALAFIRNPALEGVSHVILDEAHLRDTFTDLLMTLLKKALKLNENLKLIIMSATINTELFQSFYDCVGSVSTVKIPGRTFPVKPHFLDDLPASIISSKTREANVAAMDIPLATNVITWLHTTKPEGAILVFVSGWNDMLQIGGLLADCNDLQVIQVHSLIKDTSAAFAPSVQGKRKVILATNVAETSLTFPDVVFVVDCGVHKVQKRAAIGSCSWFSSTRSLVWVSKANVMQRKGRAGRVQAGESFHLFSHEEFQEMSEFEPPRIFSDHLENVIMNLKLIFPEKKAVDILREFPSPPHSRDVDRAVRLLKDADLLTQGEELPTLLGNTVLKISASIPSAITLVYGAVFKCLNIASSVVACAESKAALFEGDRANSRALKQMFHKTSDHIAIGKVILHPPDALSPSLFVQNTSYLRKKLLEQIFSIIHGKRVNTFIASDINVNEFDSEELLKCILLLSPCSLLTMQYSKDWKADLYNETGMVASLRTGSVNSPISKNSSSFYLYLNGHSLGRVLLVDETTAVNPLSIILCYRRNFSTTETEGHVKMKAWNSSVAVVIPSDHYLRVKSLREALKAMIDYYVSTLLNARSGPIDDLMNRFRRELIECVINITREDGVDEGMIQRRE